MQHQSLTAQIASKGKKNIQTFEPTFFSEIPYANVAQINYLRDLEEKKKNIDFPIFEFQKDFGQQAPVNEYDMLANTLYKKIMQQGYIQQKKAPSKKKKKTKNPFDYDYEDVWINDEEAITVKKNIYVKLENFKCLNQGVEQFYDSEIYKSSIAQIQQLSKKRTNEISMDAQQLEEIKKKIKQNISIAHSKIKQDNETQKPTTFVPNIQEVPINVKDQNLIQVKYESQNCQDKTQIQKDLLFLKQQVQEITKKNSQDTSKADQIKKTQKNQFQQFDLCNKPKKNISKVKSIVPKKKKQKISQLAQCFKQTQQDRENKLEQEAQNQESERHASGTNLDKINEAVDNEEKIKIISNKQQCDKTKGQRSKSPNQQQNQNEVNKT